MPYSKRKYKEAICANPCCGLKFIPHDRRQIFHTPQCGIDASNDRRRIKNATTYAKEAELREQDKKLERIYERFVENGSCVAHISYFNYERVNLLLAVEEQENLATKRPVRWFYEYGTEAHSTPDYLIIHKRSIK